MEDLKANPAFDELMVAKLLLITEDIVCVWYNTKTQSVPTYNVPYYPFLVEAFTEDVETTFASLHARFNGDDSLYVFQVGLSDEKPFAWFTGIYYKIDPPFSSSCKISIHGFAIEDDVLKKLALFHTNLSFKVAQHLLNRTITTASIVVIED
jgi:hypothetical protein